MHNHEISVGLAIDLDVKYRQYIAARAMASQALHRLMISVFALAASITETRADIRMPFAKWCLKYCTSFDPKAAKVVCSVANRTFNKDAIETWQLRLMGVVATVHHSSKPKSQKRRHKPTSWLSYISKTREEINKVIERAGGVHKLSDMERDGIHRQLASLDGLKDKMKV